MPLFPAIPHSWGWLSLRYLLKSRPHQYRLDRMRSFSAKPTYQLLVLWLLCLALGIGAAWYALRQPSLGIKLEVREDQVRVAKVTAQQAADIPPGARILSLNGMEVLPGDLNDDPDMTLDYEGINAYFNRLDTLASKLHGKEVAVVWSDGLHDNQTSIMQLHQRSMGELPMEFWFVWLVGSLCLLIGAWVYVLKPQDRAAQLFALSGLLLMVSAFPIAIYVSRELTYSGKLLRVLLALNHFGALMYVSTLIGLFLCYPRILISLRHLLGLSALYFLMFVADTVQFFFRAQDHMLAITFGMLMICIAGALQWWLARRHPLERAALRWFLLAMLIGLSLIMVTFILPPLFGVPPMLSTAYVFGFFLIMYVGIALGLRRYRLFDMDEWSYRVLLWVGGATSVIVMDALLIFAGMTEGASLGFSLLVCGWLYFPFRQWLWQRIVTKRTPNFESLLPELSTIAFTASAAEQQSRWEALLQRSFDPLEIKRCEENTSGIREEGLSLQVPGCANLPAYTLRYAGRGARLFSSRDAVFTASLSQLLEQIMSGRTSYEQGVTQERLRIGRDLHDNIGARLLKLIHHLRGTPNAEVARDAMKDLRTAIAAMDATPVPLSNALADWRAEANSRCEAANCHLHWRQSDPLPHIELAARVKATLESVIREIITNALKHATPGNIEIEVTTDAARLRVNVANDGNIADPLTWQDGYGLRNLRGRLEELHGNLNISTDANKVRLTIEAALT